MTHITGPRGMSTEGAHFEIDGTPRPSEFTFEGLDEETATSLRGLLTGALTPEAVISMMQSRVRDIDHQIGLQMAAMAERNRLAEGISDRVALLRSFLTEAQARDLIDSEGRITGDVVIDGQSMTTWLVEHDFPVTMNDRGEPSVAVTRDDLQRLIDSGSDELRAVNSQNETLMIQLQSAVQQRTSVIQLCSNILKTMDEASDTIVGNTR